MVDFPIRKQDFRVHGRSGAFWEPQERKKEKTKCSYSRPYRGEKKSASTFLPPEKKEHLEDWGAPRGLGGYQRQKWGNAHVERESPQKFNAQKDSQSALVNLG